MNPDAPLEDEFDQSDNFDTVDDEQEMTELGRVRSDFLNNNRFAPYQTILPFQHTLEYLQSILVYPDGDPSPVEVNADETSEGDDEQQKHGDEIDPKIDLDGQRTNGAKNDETT